MADKANRGKQMDFSASSLLDLRKRAEKIISTAETFIDISPEEAQKVLHELCVNQIELGMQNETLCRIQVALETARMRYFDLYDLAPVGYCTVSEHGLVLETNLATATLLGMDRNTLVKQPISQFISKKDQDIFSLHSKQLFETGEPQAYELRMVKKDGTAFWGHLTVSLAQKPYGNAVCHIILSDITAIKQAEEALRQSELELREVLDATADGILAVDRQGKAIKMNRRFVELWRIPQVLADSGDDQSMLNFVLDQLSDPDAFLKKVQSLYGSLNYDMDTLNFKDGRVFERYSAPLMQDSALIGRVWSFRDVTKNKQAEEALTDFASQWQNTFDAVTDGVCLLDCNQLIVRCNKAMSDLFSKSSSDMIGKTCWDIIHGAKEPIPECPILKMRKTLRRESTDLKISDKWFEVTVDPFFDTDKKLSGVVHIIRDITERKLSEEKIMFRNILLSIQQDASLDGILVVDENNNIRWSNCRFAEIMNIPPELIENKIDEPVLRLVTEQMADPPQFLRRVQYLYEHRREISREELILKDGRILDRYSSPMYGSDDNYYGRCWYFRDITARKQAEKEIKLKNEQLLKLNAEKDKLFSIIAHDLRSPFQGFLGLTEEMAKELPQLTKEEIHEITVGMRYSATNLFCLLENLLEWARTQQGSIPFKPDTLKLRPVVDESITTIKTNAQHKGIDITHKIPDDITVFADSNMLQTVIRNLVSNAVKFTPRHGTVSLSAKATDKSVEISVKDFGIGMDKTMQDNLFRLDTKTNRKGTEGEPSTGLGLLLCKEFVEKHDGKIWAESEEGKGTTFYFTLPYNAVAEKSVIENIVQADMPADEKEDKIKNLKILIAEDDEKSDMLITIAVRRFAREILKARTGLDAVEICRDNPDLDLVLMDIEMPEMDGDEATRQIRQFNKDVVIIAQTAYVLADEKEKAIAAGCNDYITKPYNKATLTALLKKWF